jgi:RHS repeat-associated protein
MLAALATARRIKRNRHRWRRSASGRQHYNYFRDYDPSTGRYIESDPVGLAAGVNTYAYVVSNPLVWIDPLGLSARDRGEVIGCVIGGGLGSYAGAAALGGLGGGAGLACGPGAPACSTAGITAGGAIGYAAGGAAGCAGGGMLGGAIGSFIDMCTESAEEKKQRHCQALKDSILNTCAGLTGRQKFRCFEAANTSYRQCMGYE